MHEHEPRLPRSRFAEIFGLTQNEVLFNRFSDMRLQILIGQPDVQIHSAQVDSNSYGEFLFITLSREHQGKRLHLTCYGLGYHEPRETWKQDVWSFYQSDAMASKVAEAMSKVDVQQILKLRHAEVERWAKDAPLPSQRALLFGILADLTDEDVAYSELEEIDDLTQWFDDQPE